MTPTSPPEINPPAPSGRLQTFASNAAWSVLGIAVSLAAAILMSPYLIEKLGQDGYGVWLLVFSISNYYSILDFGVRSAVIHFTAKQIALRDYTQLNGVLSTALTYAATITVLSMTTIVLLTPASAELFRIDPPFDEIFPMLFLIVCSGIALSFCSNIVSGCLEGFQQYGFLRRVQTLVLSVRTLSYFLVLYFGGGLRELVLCTFISWIIMWLFFGVRLRKVYPQFRLRWDLVHRSTLLRIGRYGVHTTTFSFSMLLLEQTPQVLISRALTEEWVGYYGLPLRMTQIPLNMIRSVTEMLSPLAAEYTAQRKLKPLAEITTLANRYSFILYAPLALLGMTWGPDVMRLWVGEEYAVNGGPLLVYFLAGTWFAQAGQSASIGVLFGMGEHRWCARGLLAEGIIVATTCYFYVDRDLLIVALATAIATLANRGLFSAWAVCRSLEIPLLPYLWSVYGVPSMLALPVFWALLKLQALLAVKTWLLIFAVSAAGSLAYLVPAFLLCVERQHRDAALHRIRRFLPGGRPALPL